MSGLQRATRRGARQTILHVDDDPLVRRSVARVLASAGFAVIDAEGGVRGLELARRAVPDLVILDVDLPDLSGFDVCVRLRADRKTRRIPVLHLSAARREIPDRVFGLENGADAYLVQPVAREELVAVVRALMARASERPRRARSENDAAAARALGLRAMAKLLRAPLSAIEINASGLNSASANYDPVMLSRAQALVEAHATAARALSELVEIADLESRRTPLVLEAVTADRLLAGAATRVERAYGEGRVVAVGGTSASTSVRCDAARIVRALGALMARALRASDPSRVARVGATSEGDEVRFSIAWEGPPAGEDERHVVDRSFWTVRLARNAPDLVELAVVRAVVDAHGGRMWFEPDHGAVHVALPVLPVASI